MEHYAEQYRDRMTYWKARERSCSEGDMVTVIVDSFDKSKLCLPMWPLGRTPKRTLYETVQRHSIFFNILTFFWRACPPHWHSSLGLDHAVPVLELVTLVIMFSLLEFSDSDHIQGANLVLTAVLCHGHGLFLFLTAREGMSAGSNWNWECVSCQGSISEPGFALAFC